MNVLPGAPAFTTVDTSRRVTEGQENKGYVITSTAPITVRIGSQTHNDLNTPDEVLLRPIHAGATDFYIVSYIGDTFASVQPLSFYTISPFEDNTEVTVYTTTGEVSETGVYDSHQAYTRQSSSNDDDFTGYHVVSDKPVGVVVGHAKAIVGDENQYVASSASSTDQLGTQYQTFPQGFGNSDNGYILRLLSTVDGTQVSIPQLSTFRTLDKGDFADIDYSFSEGTLEVTSIIQHHH